MNKISVVLKSGQMKSLKKFDPEIYKAVKGELQRQKNGVELIASENYVSEAVLETLGSVFTNKYSEGIPAEDITQAKNSPTRWKIWPLKEQKNFSGPNM